MPNLIRLWPFHNKSIGKKLATTEMLLPYLLKNFCPFPRLLKQIRFSLNFNLCCGVAVKHVVSVHSAICYCATRQHSTLCVHLYKPRHRNRCGAFLFSCRKIADNEGLQLQSTDVWIPTAIVEIGKTYSCKVMTAPNGAWCEWLSVWLCVVS